jgi:hypothetical protein
MTEVTTGSRAISSRAGIRHRRSRIIGGVESIVERRTAL